MKKYCFTLLLLISVCYGQVSFKLRGTDYTIKGDLICEYIDNSMGGTNTMSCYLEITQDSLIYSELQHKEKTIYLFQIYQIALKDIKVNEKPVIMKATWKETGKTFYEFNLFTFDSKQDVTFSTYYSNGAKNIAPLGNIGICFPTDEKARELHAKLLKK